MAENFISMCWSSLVFAFIAAALTGCGGGAPSSRAPERYWSDRKAVALAKAISQGDLGEIDKLVAAGADVNAPGKEDLSFLLWAIYKRQKPAFGRLLEHGADPAVRVQNVPTIVHFVARANKDSEWLKIVLEHGADPNTDPLNGETPLFPAIESRLKENVELLIKAGADVNHRIGGGSGDTPLIYAAGMNWFDTVYYLLEAGADYRAKGGGGLDLCYEIVDSTVDADHELGHWREKVISWLRERGVTFDEAERMLDERAQMAERAAARGNEGARRNAEIMRARLKYWHEEEEARKALSPKSD